MSWQKKAGHEHDHIDGRTGTHFIRLENSVTGGVHELHIRLGVDCCSHCSRPLPKGDLGAVDPKAIVAEALEMLIKNHQAVLDYAEKHGIAVKAATHTLAVPEGYRRHSNNSPFVHPVKKSLVK